MGYLTQFKDQNRKLILINPSTRITKLLEVAQIISLFPIYDDVDAALAAEN